MIWEGHMTYDKADGITTGYPSVGESVTQVAWVSSSLPFSLPSFPFRPETRDTQTMAQHAKTNDKAGNPVTSS